MGYKIVVTKDAKEDLERFIKYLIFELVAQQWLIYLEVKAREAMNFLDS